MKLHFDPNLDYQIQVIEAVCAALFRGQKKSADVNLRSRCHPPPPESDDTFNNTSGNTTQLALGVAQSDLGVGNRLTVGMTNCSKIW